MTISAHSGCSPASDPIIPGGAIKPKLMPSQHRINVSSGRPLEGLAHYSRALRVGAVVLQSGTTAIDREGNVLGDTVTAQIEAILKLARDSMGAAQGVFEDVVRARLYVTDNTVLDEAGRAFDRAFAGINPAIMLVPICQLARPAQLIEIELEAVDGAAATAQHIDASECVDYGTGAVVVGGRILVGGIASSSTSATAQTDQALNAVLSLLDRAGGTSDDLVGIKFFVTDISRSAEIISRAGSILGSVKPTVTIIGIPPLLDAEVGLIVEAEGVIGAGRRRLNTPHPRFPAFSRSVCVDEHIYLSNFEPLNESASVQHAGDWAAQIDYCIENLGSTLEQLGASLDDVVMRRFFTRAGAEMNRVYGEGPGWFAATRPTALGCRIVSHLDDESLISVEAHALRGAGENIDWRTIDV